MAEYRIVVDFNGGGDGYKSEFFRTVETENAVNTSSQIAGQSFSTSAFGMLENGLSAFAGLKIVKEMEKLARQVFSNEIQKVGRYTGSQQAQDVANATLDLISWIRNPYESAIAYNYKREQREYDRKWESIGLNLYRERGGVSFNRSRSEV